MRRRSWEVALGIALAMAGCADDATCDEGSVLAGGLCIPASSSGDAGTGSDAGTESDAGDGADASGDAADELDAGHEDRACLEQTCTASDQCSCEANSCAIRPGETEGYCTLTGCKDDPSICPDGWTCFDLSAFDPSLPSICQRPS